MMFIQADRSMLCLAGGGLMVHFWLYGYCVTMPHKCVPLTSNSCAQGEVSAVVLLLARFTEKLDAITTQDQAARQQ